MPEKVLFVDDEPNVLNAFKRQMRNYSDFIIETAFSGESALKIINPDEPFAVIVADMRMPGMDGIELLKEIQRISPSTVRMMLTGNTDQKTAVEAVNEGKIFRFLSKPCSTEQLIKAVNDSLAQFRLINAEKELLGKTLRGSIKVLTDLLGMVDPDGFGQAMSLRASIREAAKILEIDNPWNLELATMLAGIGTLVLPPEVAAKARKEEVVLSETERQLIERVPEISRDLLKNIPRLEGVAEAIHYQNKYFDGSGYPHDQVSGEKIPFPARLLRVIHDLDNLEAQGKSRQVAINELIAKTGRYDPQILERMRKHYSEKAPLPTAPEAVQQFAVKPSELLAGQKLMADLYAKNGMRLMAAGAVLSEPQVERLLNYNQYLGLKEPIMVNARIPGNDGKNN